MESCCKAAPDLLVLPHSLYFPAALYVSIIQNIQNRGTGLQGISH